MNTRPSRPPSARKWRACAAVRGLGQGGSATYGEAEGRTGGQPMTRGPPLKAEEGSVAAQEAELAKSAITNESRAQHYAMPTTTRAWPRLRRDYPGSRRPGEGEEMKRRPFVTQNEAIDRCRRPQNEHCPGGRVLVFAKGNCRPKKNFDPSVSQLDRYGPRAREPIIATPPVRVDHYRRLAEEAGPSGGNSRPSPSVSRPPSPRR
jgi:hypothetical protein